ncbi:MAG TPA: ATPase domain-containing protein [Candidatus Dormibacteraeota bacterium]|nr:ATPase domain-containing protein [Candidatus Dormibacteraeota bacterium]
MLTIFGKKKKDETDEAQGPPEPLPGPPQAPQSQPSLNSPSPTQAPTPASNPTPSTDFPPQTFARQQNQPVFRPPPNAPLPQEETSLTKLLQSLLSDVSGAFDSESFQGPAQSTPEYVPIRSTPPSRPMVIGPGKDTGDWEEQAQPSTKQPSIAPPGKSSKAEAPTPTKPTPPPPIQKKDQTSEKAPDKPTRIEKQPEKQAPKKETRAPQSFDHIFQLTQGNLENAGLVIINGEAGSGRTTLCAGLTSNYMKMGNPCLYLTYDQAPTALRDQMKKLGTDAAQYESSFRFIIVDGFAAQADSFSTEMYYVEQPFSFDNIQDTLTRNSQFFVGEKIRVIFDSLDALAAKVLGKDFAKGLTDMAGKLKDSGATFIVTVDLSKLPKDTAATLTDLADCVVELSKDGSDPNGRELKIQRLNHSPAKVDAETFEIDANKGLVFV